MISDPQKTLNKYLQDRNEWVSGWIDALMEKIKSFKNRNHFLRQPSELLGFPGGSEVKVSACNVGDRGSIPGLGRSPGEGNDNPLQYYCLENPMGGGAWWVHGVAKSWTRLSDFTFTVTFRIVA